MNRTAVLILQHRRERFHPFNTARIVNQSLNNCELLVEHNLDMAQRFDSMKLADNVGLLYPGEDAQLLSELTASERPEQLVILDGTWSHAKTILRDIPRLRSLPRYRLAPSSPGRYRIRREPNADALSTLEATVSALQILEPETIGLNRLLVVFEKMIDDQLSNPKSNWRKNERRGRGGTNSPRVLLGDLSNVVVAYGEQEFGQRDAHVPASIKRKPLPIYWAAQRLVSGEQFRCAIESTWFRDKEFIARLRLNAEDIDQAVSIESFRERWQSFLRPDDHVAVYHESTTTMLQTIGADFVPSVILKSIKVNGEPQRGTLDDVLIAFGIQMSPIRPSRAAERLAGAVALIEFLRR